MNIVQTRISIGLRLIKVLSAANMLTHAAIYSVYMLFALALSIVKDICGSNIFVEAKYPFIIHLICDAFIRYIGNTKRILQKYNNHKAASRFL